MMAFFAFSGGSRPSVSDSRCLRPSWLRRVLSDIRTRCRARMGLAYGQPSQVPWRQRLNGHGQRPIPPPPRALETSLPKRGMTMVVSKKASGVLRGRSPEHVALISRTICSLGGRAAGCHSVFHRRNSFFPCQARPWFRARRVEIEVRFRSHTRIVSRVASHLALSCDWASFADVRPSPRPLSRLLRRGGGRLRIAACDKPPKSSLVHGILRIRTECDLFPGRSSPAGYCPTGRPAGSVSQTHMDSPGTAGMVRIPET